MGSGIKNAGTKRSVGKCACLRQPIAHDTASAALPHGMRQVAQLGFVVKSPTIAAIGSACTAMSSSIEQDDSTAFASWRSLRAVPTDVTAPFDDSGLDVPMLGWQHPASLEPFAGLSTDGSPSPVREQTKPLVGNCCCTRACSFQH